VMGPERVVTSVLEAVSRASGSPSSAPTLHVRRSHSLRCLMLLDLVLHAQLPLGGVQGWAGVSHTNAQQGCPARGAPPDATRQLHSLTH